MNVAKILLIGVPLALACAVHAAPESPDAAKDGVVRWIGVGGGFDPRSTQVSLEQDLMLARNILGPDGLIFFAGGDKVFGVQVLNRKKRPPTLVQRLGDLLDPQDARDATIRRPRLKPARPATAEAVQTALKEALAHGDDPLLLYVATHGEMGETARDNRVLLWSGTELTVGELAKVLDEATRRRQVRVVVTSCYSGGFADIVFEGADPARGATDADRCGFFASQWDQVSSGCDPDPNRRVQQGYGMHFLQALRGRSRDRYLLADEAIDFDGNGKISLLEAHTRARVKSASIDVPTTTSERWLRHAAPQEGPTVEVALPEEDVVIAVLQKELEVENEAAARQQREAVKAHMKELEEKLKEAEKNEAIRFEKMRVAMLEHWPVLDDPWHPHFLPLVRRHADSVEAFLAAAPEVRLYRQERRKIDRQALRYDRTRLRAAILERLLRAYENRALAGRLRAAGGAAWERYERLLACERGAP